VINFPDSLNSKSLSLIACVCAIPDFNCKASILIPKILSSYLAFSIALIIEFNPIASSPKPKISSNGSVLLGA